MGNVKQQIEEAFARWEPFSDPKKREFVPLFASELAAYKFSDDTKDQKCSVSLHHASSKATTIELDGIVKSAARLLTALEGLHLEATSALANNGALIRTDGLLLLLPRLVTAAKAAQVEIAGTAPPPSSGEARQIKQLEDIQEANCKAHSRLSTKRAVQVRPGAKRDSRAHGITERLFDIFETLRRERPDGARGFVPVVKVVFRILGIKAQAQSVVDEVSKRRSAAFTNI